MNTKQHVCQHTGRGESACEACANFGPLPAILHITVASADKRSAHHFSKFWNNVSHISLASTVSEQAADAIAKGVALS